MRDSFDVLDAAEIWPRPTVMPAAPLAEIESGLRSAPAVPDLPVAVGRAVVTVYAALILAFAALMGGSAEALFMIAISGFYVAIFLAVPRLFLGVENDPSLRPNMARFMHQGMATHTGRMSGSSALVQMFLVPVLLTLTVFVIGVAALWILP
jgi:hypothetical protein